MRRTTIVALSLCLAATLAAQETADQGVFTPYVSRIRVGVNQESVVLTWEDSVDATGSCVVYRSKEPISSSSFSGAEKLATVPYGVQRYVDSPPSSDAEWYYAVLALDATSVAYEIFIPFKNSTAIGVATEPKATSATASPDERFTLVGSLSAKIDNDAVILSYKAESLGHRLVIYRGSAPIAAAANVLNASIVSIVDDTVTEVRDYPVPGIDYYYAVIDENTLRRGGVDVRPGENSTKSSVRIEAGVYRIGLPAVSPLSRAVPLPGRIYDSAIGTGERLGSALNVPEPRQIASQAEKAIDRILKSIPSYPKAVPAVTILDHEGQNPGTGEDYTLAGIVRETIQKKDWPEAISQLEKFLSIHRSQETEMRARFYLGEAYAANKDFQDALFSLLVAQDSYYRLTREWIDYCLAELKSESKISSN
jgi:tetratricopeptide (TPR) repeat protein